MALKSPNLLLFCPNKNTEKNCQILMGRSNASAEQTYAATLPVAYSLLAKNCTAAAEAAV